MAKDQWPDMIEHVRVKRIQAAAFKSFINMTVPDHESFNPDTAVIQVDWAENYKCISQDEIQPANWSQFQISVFTPCVWYDAKRISKAYVTDSKDHTKKTIAPLVKLLLDTLPESVNTVHIWTDGAWSQFKSRYIVQLVKHLQETCEVNIVWHYFETSHGKVRYFMFLS